MKDQLQLLAEDLVTRIAIELNVGTVASEKWDAVRNYTEKILNMVIIKAATLTLESFSIHVAPKPEEIVIAELSDGSYESLTYEDNTWYYSRDHEICSKNHIVRWFYPPYKEN